MKLYLIVIVVAGLLYILAIIPAFKTIESLQEKIEARQDISITE